MLVDKIVVTRTETLELRPEVRPYVSAWKKIEYTLEHVLREGENADEIKDALTMILESWVLREKTKWLEEVKNRRG